MRGELPKLKRRWRRMENGEEKKTCTKCKNIAQVIHLLGTTIYVSFSMHGRYTWQRKRALGAFRYNIIVAVYASSVTHLTTLIYHRWEQHSPKWPPQRIYVHIIIFCSSAFTLHETERYFIHPNGQPAVRCWCAIAAAFSFYLALLWHHSDCTLDFLARLSSEHSFFSSSCER